MHDRGKGRPAIDTRTTPPNSWKLPDDSLPSHHSLSTAAGLHPEIPRFVVLGAQHTRPYRSTADELLEDAYRLQQVG